MHSNLELNMLKTLERTVAFRITALSSRTPTTAFLYHTVRDCDGCGTLQVSKNYYFLLLLLGPEMWIQELLHCQEGPAENVPPVIDKDVQTTTEPVLITSVTVWVFITTSNELERLQSIVGSIERFIGRNLPSLKCLFSSRSRKHVGKKNHRAVVTPHI